MSDDTDSAPPTGAKPDKPPAPPKGGQAPHPVDTGAQEEAAQERVDTGGYN